MPRTSKISPVAALRDGLKIHFGTQCPGSESNQPHADFQSAALPNELPGPGSVSYDGQNPASSLAERVHAGLTSLRAALETLGAAP